MHFISFSSPLFFYSAILVASFLASSLGIGGFFLIPLAALAFGAKESVGLITLYFLIQNVIKIFFFRDAIVWKTAQPMMLWSLPGVFAGAMLLPFIPVAIFQKVLSCAVFFFLLNDMFRWFRTTGISARAFPFFGICYGFASGLLGSGNLVKGTFLRNLGLSKESYLGTYAVTSLAMNIPKVAIYASTGIIQEHTLIIALPFLLFSLVGTASGKAFLKLIPVRAFSLVLHLVLLTSAFFLFLQS